MRKGFIDRARGVHILWAASTTLALASVSCGGETKGSGSSCPAVPACGGNLVGVWHVVSLCSSVPLGAITGPDGGTGLPAECNGAFQGALDNAVATPVDATVQFTADGQFIQGGTVTVAFPVDYTSACLAALGSPPASTSVCGQLGNGFAAVQPGATGTCSAAADGCQCSTSLPEDFSGTSTYRTEGTSLFVGSDPSGSPYCVQGKSASIALSNPDGSSGTMALTAD